jgi:hypothetical protein
MADNNAVPNQIQTVEHKEHFKQNPSIANLSRPQKHRNSSFDNTDRQDYAAETKKSLKRKWKKFLQLLRQTR